MTLRAWPYSQVLSDEEADSATAFLRAAVAYYAGLGVQIREIMTDNGGCYRSRLFAQACRDLGLRHRFTRPYTPRTNGKAERFIQSALREWAYARAYQRSAQRIADLPHWLHRYNWHRPHSSLAGQPPVSRLGLNRNNLLRLHT
jgi:transposase InsO family protein